MKVKIAYTVEVTDGTRRGIRRHYGQGGLATPAEIRNWYWMYGMSANDDLDDRPEGEEDE